MPVFPCAIHVSMHCANPREDLKDKVRRYEVADARKLRARLRELDAEWDTERVFEAVSAGMVLAGVAMGAVHSRKWLFFSALAGALMMERALRGWSPLQPALRRLGVRTAPEIEAEKDAIKDILTQRKEQYAPEEAEE
jgi:hypothetical protein